MKYSDEKILAEARQICKAGKNGLFLGQFDAETLVEVVRLSEKQTEPTLWMDHYMQALKNLGKYEGWGNGKEETRPKKHSDIVVPDEDIRTDKKVFKENLEKVLKDRKKDQ